MQSISRPVALLLLVTMAAALSAVQAFALSGSNPAHAAPCHHQGPISPAPARSDYQCCVTGHHQAMASASFSLRPALAMRALEAGDRLRLCSGPFSPAAVLAIPSVSPPCTPPLRI